MYIDITREIDDGLAPYPGNPPVRRWCYRTLPGDPYQASLLTLGAHAGTHVDAPKHFFENGIDVAALPLEVLCGPARVFDVRGAGRQLGLDVIGALDLAGVERMLLRTAEGPAAREIALAPSAARYLVDETAIRLVGVDVPSIESGETDFPAHRVLLGSSPPVFILEGLDLADVTPGDYELYCLPLRWRGAEGCPARAVLRR